MTNATKHGGNRTFRLVLREQFGDRALRINNDGLGCVVDQTTQSHGFDNRRDRLALVGGHLVLNSTVGVSPIVTATVSHPS